MSHLQRTQIYIEEEQIHQLKIEARKEHMAVSELIRMAIDRFLQAREKRLDWNKDPLSKAIGKIKLNVSDASLRHNEYLYKKDG